MKVIKTDNFDRNYIPDSLICENCTDYNAKFIAEALNKMCNPNGSDYFRAVHDDYKMKLPEI